MSFVRCVSYSRRGGMGLWTEMVGLLAFDIGINCLVVVFLAHLVMGLERGVRERWGIYNMVLGLGLLFLINCCTYVEKR